MFGYSIFKHEWTKSRFCCTVPNSKDYKVFVNGEDVPVYTCRISKYPFNTWWPGHQRPLDQSQEVSYVNLVSDEDLHVEVEVLTKTDYKRVMLKPYSKEVSVQTGERISFTLSENGGYVLELDDYHGLLYIFNQKPVTCEKPEDVTYYFGKGVHFPGKITLKSNESIYVDKDALVFGCIYAEDAENLRIYGNGIFDDSSEARVFSHCYEPYTNGNLKFYDCKNVKIEGVGFMNSAIWCINLFHCFDVEIDGISVFGQWRYNTDGIDIVNSQRITVRNSFVHSFDDTITVKGIDRYAFEDNADMLFENCVLWCDWGKTMEIGLETECDEYRNIVFRNNSLLRAGSTACDIQNGDRATVHDILFENNSMELESFYTPEEIQRTQEQGYSKANETAVARFLSIENKRFRASYDAGRGDESGLGTPDFAGVHHVAVKGLRIYADREIMEKYGTKCARVKIGSVIPTTVYHDITVEDVILCGIKLEREDMEIKFENCAEDVLTVK